MSVRQSGGSTAKKIAKECGISSRTVERYAETAKKFEQLQKENPELADAVWQGKISLAKAIPNTPKPKRSLYDKAVRAIDGCKDEAEALQMYTWIAEIKLRAERRIGEFSMELPKNEGKVNQYTKSAVPRCGEQQS